MLFGTNEYTQRSYSVEVQRQRRPQRVSVWSGNAIPSNSASHRERLLGYPPIGQEVPDEGTRPNQRPRQDKDVWAYLGIVCGMFLYFMTGVSETVMSAYFSVEARGRGLDSVQIGAAVTMMEASNFGFSFLVMYLIKAKTERIFWISGMLISGLGTGLAGLLQWIDSDRLFMGVAIVSQTLDGVGGALSLATTIPMMTDAAASRNTGSVIAWAEALLSLGCLVGAPIGSLLYHLFGFCVPSFVTGSFFILCAILSTIFVIKAPSPSQHSSISHPDILQHQLSKSQLSPQPLPTPKFDSLAYIKFILSPNLLLTSSLAIIVSAQIAFFDVCVSLYLNDVFRLNALQIGLMFLAFGASNLAMTPVYGIIVDRGYTVHTMLLTSLGFSVTFSLLYMPALWPSHLQNIPFTVVCFILAGIFSAGAFVPGYLFYQKIAEMNNRDNGSTMNAAQIKILVTTWCNNLYALGFMIGSLVLSGPVFQNYGFPTTNLVLACSMLFFLVLCTLYVCKRNLFVKLFHDGVEQSAAVSVSSSQVFTNDSFVTEDQNDCDEDDNKIDNDNTCSSSQSSPNVSDDSGLGYTVTSSHLGQLPKTSLDC